LTSTPGSGSASRAEPIGISGEAAIAIATATAAAATVTTASRAMASASKLPLVMPTARRIGNSAASSASCLASSWPRTASEISPASPANTASATACGLMARSVAATSSDRLMVSIGCTAWYGRPSVRACAATAPGFAPGRSRSPAVGR